MSSSYPFFPPRLLSAASSDLDPYCELQHGSAATGLLDQLNMFLVAHLKSVPESKLPAKIKETFQLMDLDGSGELTAQEVRIFFPSPCTQPDSFRPAPPAHALSLSFTLALALHPNQPTILPPPIPHTHRVPLPVFLCLSSWPHLHPPDACCWFDGHHLPSIRSFKY